MLAHLEIRSHKSGMGREGQKNIPKLREHEVNEKTIPNFVNGNRMKKSIPIIWERESEAFILGNGRESFATVGEIRVYWRADFQSGSRVLKKVF